ncbi:hypothetical protein [Streptomyces sp. NBC_00344]|uniref:hypothetical protein n=1 Tax=Streptomyces sp. NBC_00344 TaxID=2975720 RepID=UPI002E220444
MAYEPGQPERDAAVERQETEQPRREGLTGHPARAERPARGGSAGRADRREPAPTERIPKLRGPAGGPVKQQDPADGTVRDLDPADTSVRPQDPAGHERQDPAGHERRDPAGHVAERDPADGGRLIPSAERDKLGLRLQQAVNGFVDAPRSAVEQADRIFEETAARVTETLNERGGSLRTAWNHGSDQESATEELRLALRTYREVTERLLKL